MKSITQLEIGTRGTLIYFTNSVELNIVFLDGKILFVIRPSSSPGLAVKEYIRAGAGQQVPDLHDLRPPPVLMKTIDHLMKK